MEVGEFLDLMFYNISLANSKRIEPTHITVHSGWGIKFRDYFLDNGSSSLLQVENWKPVSFCGVKIAYSSEVGDNQIVIGIERLSL